MTNLLISPFRALQKVAANDLSGHLNIYHPNDNSVGWKIYVGGKRLHYATTIASNVERISCLWRQYEVNAGDRLKLQSKLDNLESTIAEALSNRDLSTTTLVATNKDYEYSALTEWHQQTDLPLADFRQLIVKISTEALIQAISLNRARVEFVKHPYLEPLLVSVPIANLLKPALPKIRQWQHLHSYISSPLVRFDFELDKARLKCRLQVEMPRTPAVEIMRSDAPTPQWFDLLSKQACLYEVARAADVDTLTMANWLQPLLEGQMVSVLPYSRDHTAQPLLPTIGKDESTSASTIACIDDSASVQRQVRMVLEMSGHQVISITDPASSLTALVRQKPDLILMDINMPDINGYELSKMLKQTRHLRNVPIVMLTGRSGLVNRMRAQLVGASDFLAKPVEPHQLLATIDKLIKPTSNAVAS
ncbi:response regulator receiver protein [Thalassoporum mexicanum PCC 7367]|uniref:response regulator n=1 Tax=Thalassoporum mexicanum TaxID=3457544 RepID=UPI00029FBD98|nr:response regulator [Pseudanabaena sp. PCC 7367]AFY70401.1 response regulator receiver protein [Pseudanabaena sp. PCC 7367]